MNKQMESELKTKGFSVVNENGIAYLHITSQLHETLSKDNVLGDQMMEFIVQNHIGKIITH